MVNSKVQGESRWYRLECGHRKRLKDKTAEKGKIWCFSCRKEVETGEPE